MDIFNVFKLYNISLLFRKGISQSALPYRRAVPNWLKLSKEDVEDQIVKLAKKGLTPSQIGKFLLTQFGCKLYKVPFI